MGKLRAICKRDRTTYIVRDRATHRVGNGLRFGERRPGMQGLGYLRTKTKWLNSRPGVQWLACRPRLWQPMCQPRGRLLECRPEILLL